MKRKYFYISARYLTIVSNKRKVITRAAGATREKEINFIRLLATPVVINKHDFDKRNKRNLTSLSF